MATLCGGASLKALGPFLSGQPTYQLGAALSEQKSIMPGNRQGGIPSCKLIIDHPNH